MRQPELDRTALRFEDFSGLNSDSFIVGQTDTPTDIGVRDDGKQQDDR